MELSGKKILVVGLGKTGIQTVKFLLKKGVNVINSQKRQGSLSAWE
jgi:UDP-N-acetylmuramoylalanine-D-glutamate ligase